VRQSWAARLAQVGPIVQRAVARGQLPSGTSEADLMKYLSAPLFHRLLVTAEPVTQAAAAAALAAARPAFSPCHDRPERILRYECCP
jgi:hypothetical protein